MSNEQPQVGWRVKIGFAIFAASIGWPILIPVLPLLGVSATTTATVSGIMIVAAEFMLIAAAAIAGKDGFAFIKATPFGFLKSYGPPREVGRARYTIGLVMFVTPLAIGWALPYIGHYFTSLGTDRLIWVIVPDVMLLISLFVLGGSFWDKLRSLLKHDAYAVIPDKVDAEGDAE